MLQKLVEDCDAIDGGLEDAQVLIELGEEIEDQESEAAERLADALEQALHARRPTEGSGLVHHSDRGVQYVSIRYTERLAEAGIEPSVGSVGDSYDNALAEILP